VLAYVGDDVRIDLVGDDPPRLTGQTLVTRASLGKDLDAVRERGYALEREEAVLGEAGVAVAIFDRNADAIGAIGVVGPRERVLRRGRERTLGSAVIAARTLWSSRRRQRHHRQHQRARAALRPGAHDALGSPSFQTEPRQDSTMIVPSPTTRFLPLTFPSKAVNSLPTRGEISTREPMTAACCAESVYTEKSPAADALKVADSLIVFGIAVSLSACCHLHGLELLSVRAPRPTEQQE
jgi:hypothetical protein